MLIMVVGDTHGTSPCLRYKAQIAQNLGITKMVVVGDFGMWPGIRGVRFLDEANAIGREFGQTIYALPGNHEDHPQWDKWLSMGMPKDRAGFTYVRSNVLISPKVHNWKWDDKRFYILGGAVSIDKQWRIEGESWWPNETFSEDNLNSVLKYEGPPVDYLFTHDCSDGTPWGFHLVPDPDSKENRQRIDKAIAVLRPNMHFHGHMHRKYDWLNTFSHGQKNTSWGTDDSEWSGCATHTYGLDCDGEHYSWGVLDTERDRFSWPDGVAHLSLES